MDVSLAAVLGVITVIGTGATLAKFWMDMGKTAASASTALTSAALAHAKVDMLSTNLAEYKEKAAEKFASGHDIVAAEQRFAIAVDGLGTRFDQMASRLDRVLENLVPRPHA